MYYTLFVNTVFDIFCCFMLFCNDEQKRWEKIMNFYERLKAVCDEKDKKMLTDGGNGAKVEPTSERCNKQLL